MLEHTSSIPTTYLRSNTIRVTVFEAHRNGVQDDLLDGLLKQLIMSIIGKFMEIIIILYNLSLRTKSYSLSLATKIYLRILEHFVSTY